MNNPSFNLCSLLISLTLVLACGQKESQDQAPKPAAAPKLLVFHCEGGKSFAVEFDNKGEMVLLKMDGKSIKLPHVPSGSGAKYSDGGTTVWMKGDEAFVELDGKIILKDCKVKR